MISGRRLLSLRSAFLLALMLMLHGANSSPGPCGNWTHYGNSCYKFFNISKSWYNASTSCQSENSFLVTIDDISENQFVITTLTSSYSWIGLNDISQEGQFEWVSGSTSSYRRWSPDEPNNVDIAGYPPGEDCTHVYNSKPYWNDYPCLAPLPYVCEKAVECVTPLLANGKVHVLNTTHQSRNVQFTCQDGYNLIGSSSAVCLVNGSWSNPTPVCTIVDCGDFNSLVNGRVSVINTTYQSRVNFTCQDGYNLIGSSSAVCLVNGSWSNPTPVCSIVDCGDPSLMNGKVHVINTNYQSRVNFTCQDGYNLIGSSSSVCSANGQWSNQLPLCTIVDCGEFPTLVNGKVHVIHTTYQSRANFTCLNGYDIDGASSSVCLFNGTWSNQMPQCTSVDVKTIQNATSITVLFNSVSSLQKENYTVEVAEAIITKIENLTATKNLTASEVNDTVNVLESLITLQEKVLEDGNLSLSDDFIDKYVEVSGNLLSTKTTNSWLALDSNQGAPAFLESMERFARLTAFSKAPEVAQAQNFSSDHVALTISTVSDSNVQDLVVPVDVRETNGTNMTSMITAVFPAASLSQLLEGNSIRQLAAVSLVFNNLEEFMPPNTISAKSALLESVGDLRKKSDQLPGTSIVSLSIVVAGKQYNASSAKQKLKEPVNISYITSVEGMKYMCSFWEFGSNSEPGFWSSSGVTTDVINDTTILCSSSHLTSFSVLVAVQDAEVTETLSYITTIGCGISIACLFLTLICLIIFRRHLHFEKNFIHINFIIALILALIFFVTGIDSDNKEICEIVTVILHYLFLAVFCWMLCEGIFLYLMLVVVFDSGKTYWKRFSVLGWGLPVIIVAISFGARFDDYGKYEYCFLTHHNGLIYAFIAPMIVILLANFLVFITAVRITVSKVSQVKGQFAAVKSGLRAAAVLMPILGLTWVVGVFAVDTLSLSLAYVFAILNSLQGMFVFIFYCLLDVKVQKAFRKTKRRWTRSKSTFTSKTGTGRTRSTNTLSTNSTSGPFTISDNEDSSPPPAAVMMKSLVTDVEVKDSKFFIGGETKLNSSCYRWVRGDMKWRRDMIISSYDNDHVDMKQNGETSH